MSQPTAGDGNSVLLVAFVQTVATTTNITVRNRAAESVRILGTLGYDETRGFHFADPIAWVGDEPCVRQGGKVVCGGRAAAAVPARGESEMTGSGALHRERREDSAEALRASA